MTSTTTIRKSYGNRKLYSFPEDYPSLRSPKQRTNNNTNVPKKSEEIIKLSKYIDDNIVGKNNAFLGPFGRRKVVYCDYAASGRSLQFIEEYILREVLPSYGNTHSTTSITSLQSTVFRQEARDIIKNAVNAMDTDAVIFTGHGCTDALQKLINALDLREPPIVFTSFSEHHDNLHLWHEIGAKMVRIAETKDGYLDLDDLENQLIFHQNYGRQMIGCFSIASNVTGILIDDLACTILLHQYQALAFWDYNIAAPSITIDMNPFLPGVEENSAYKDAIYFSGHKFIGGVQTPGILIAKKVIFRRQNSYETDGFFTTQEYNKSFETQEEGSCAAIVESIRAGLVMQLKETVTVTNILQRQEKINKQMLQHIRTIPEIILLGNTSPNLKRLPVFSFMVRHPRGSFLHHNFVCAVLNDVFGIQARAGCPCSGAYAQDLLGIDPCLADQYENIILEDRRLSSFNLGLENSTLELLRPGFTRISLPYFISDSELAFIMEAVKMVATEGWKLLPQYIVELETGEWRHHSNAISKDRKWLSSIRYIDGKMTMNERRISGPGLFPQNYSECLQTARNLFNKARKTANRTPYNDQGIIFDTRTEKLRWFMLQNEAQNILTSNAQNIKQKVPFDPVSYNGSKRTVTSSNNTTTVATTTMTTVINQTTNSTTSTSTTATVNNSGSPRHYSFPSIDDPRLLTCSSPVPYFLQDVNGLYYPHLNHSQATTTTTTVNFQLGEAISATNLQQLHHQQQQNFARERCLSLGAPNISPPILSPQTRISLGMNNQYRQRNFSYSSQNELHSLESDLNISPTHSLNILCNTNVMTSLHTASSNTITNTTSTTLLPIQSLIPIPPVLPPPPPLPTQQHQQQQQQQITPNTSSGGLPDLKTYVTEMTKELATNIKSEIREVISKVEDVLENTTNDNSNNMIDCCRRQFCDRHGSGGGSSEDGRSDSISANEVEYIEKLSIEMANEVKSEIRDVVSAVDVFITPESYSRASSTTSDYNKEYTPGSSSETVLHLINQTIINNCDFDDYSNGDDDDDEIVLTDNKFTDNKNNKILQSTVASVSSQDSGINLSFQEQEYLNTTNNNDYNKTRSNSETLTNNRKYDIKFSTLQKQRQKYSSSSQRNNTDNINNSIGDGDNKQLTKWFSPSKTIWQPTIEAIQEYDMIKDGDKVMVCLSGGKDSLTLLHTLLQYQNYIQNKGILFSLGAITVDPDTSGCDPCKLISHLRSLGVHYIIDDKKSDPGGETENREEAKENLYSFCISHLRHRLYAAAKSSGYNVLAIGQHLDDLCESFLLSAFHTGRLRTMRAHYYIKEHDLRVVRPFVYVRDKYLRQFITTNQNLPILLNQTINSEITKERQRIKQLLTQQEILYPKLFISLRSALHPLIRFQIKECDDIKYRRRLLKSKNLDNNSDCTSENETDEEPVTEISN